VLSSKKYLLIAIITLATLLLGFVLSGYLTLLLLGLDTKLLTWNTYYQYFHALGQPQVAPFVGKIKWAGYLGFGLPLLVLFFGSIRVLSLVEGRIVEALLGQRMPRRPPYINRDRPWLSRIGDMFTDGRTWSTMLYLLLMLPLGIVYFTLATVLLSTSLTMLASPLLYFWDDSLIWVDGVPLSISHVWAIPLVTVAGLLLLFVTLHVARGIGHMHGWLAKQLLVHSPVV